MGLKEWYANCHRRASPNQRQKKGVPLNCVQLELQVNVGCVWRRGFHQEAIIIVRCGLGSLMDLSKY